MGRVGAATILTMKNLRILGVWLALLAGVSAHAGVFQVKNLNASGSSVVLIPGQYAKIIIIQNNGSNSVRLSLDGGTGYQDAVTGKFGTNPTPTTGYLLPAGQQLTISTPAASSNGDPGTHKPIVAIMVTGTTILDLITDEFQSIAPTT